MDMRVNTLYSIGDLKIIIYQKLNYIPTQDEKIEILWNYEFMEIILTY